ncbi:MAG: Fic family protein, partial [Chitinophagales bacterium]
ITFALKYEGVDLGVFKTLFSELSKEEVELFISSQPTGKYSRIVWFLYEWLMEEELNLKDAKSGNFVDVLNPKLQYVGSVEICKRYRVRNNLPGVKDFCPLIRKTPYLEEGINQNYPQKTKTYFKNTHKEVLLRASVFLLLKDSKASYTIEGETPPHNRIQRWGRAIGEAGRIPLSEEELLRLQEMVMGSGRFVKLGWRKQGGFIGEHDRELGVPIPEHISAKWEDVSSLMSGLLAMNQKLLESNFDAVLAASIIAFGFVFIHPFVDGNGRIHRYLIHHVLARKGFYSQGFTFPISAAILENISTYAKVLRTYSYPRLDLIEWGIAADKNVEILNETTDLYRYFDATKMAEFLYACVKKTIEEIIPEEVEYLQKYDRFKRQIDSRLEMPDKMVALLVRFLSQAKGKLSKRARKKEFKGLEQEEISWIEDTFEEVFGS